MIYKFETLKHRVNSKYIFQVIHNRKLSNIYHSHDFYEWIIVMNGIGKQKINNRTVVMHKNDCVLLCPGDCHCFLEQSEDCVVISMSVEKNEICQFENVFGLSENRLRYFFTTLSAKQVQSITNLYYISKEYEYKFFLANLIKIYIDGFNSNDTVPATLKSAMEQMNKHENLRGGAERFSELSQYSRSHLSRLMKKYFNVTIHEYIMNIRLETAYRLLIFSDTDAQILAETIGYDSFSHFCKVFKQKYGMTPAEVRKKYKMWTI